MTVCKIHWGVRNEEPILSLEQLDATMDRLAAEHPGDRAVLASVVMPGGDSLAIGLGKSVSVLTWVGASGDPPYYTSLGDEGYTGTQAEKFFFGGHWTEFHRRSVIPIDDAREAVRHFFRTGERSPAIRWSED